MSTNGDLLVSTRPTPGLLGMGQFAAEQRTLDDSENINNMNQQEDVFRSHDFGHEDSIMQLPQNSDEKIDSAVDKESPATIQNNCQRADVGCKETPKRKTGRAVKSISEWIFPPGTKNKHDFVVSSCRRGIEPKVTLEHKDEPKSVRSTSPSLSTRNNSHRVNRKRTFHEREFGSKTMVHPIVKGAEFDKRFLRYELSPDGEKKEDVLVRVLSLSTIPMRNFSHAKEAWERNWIEPIPDEPSRSDSSSRIGPRYQARVPPKARNNARPDTAVDSVVPGYSMLWDPKLADEAERRGEDISGFLRGKHELCTHELLITILHNNNYSVNAAQKVLERMQRRKHALPSSKLNEDESRQFRDLILETQKDFSSIAKSLKRTRSDCLVHYYNWKASNRRYQRMKKVWSDEGCTVCGEVGLLIICDGCNSNFHMECVTPPLTEVPKGNWFCDTCRHTARTVPSIYNGKKTLSPQKKSRSRSIRSDPETTSLVRDEIHAPARY